MSFRSDKLNNLKTKRMVTYSDDRGWLYEVLRNDDDMFVEFGQIYLNWTDPGIIKGFHSHTETDDYVCCIEGRVKLVVLDEETEEARLFYLGPEQNQLVHIPRGLMHGWQCLGNTGALTLNVTTRPYDEEANDKVRVRPNHFSWFSWDIDNR